MSVAGTASSSKGIKQHTSFLDGFSWHTQRPTIAAFKSPRREQAQLYSRKVLHSVFICTVFPAPKSGGAHGTHIPITPVVSMGRCNTSSKPSCLSLGC